MADQAYITEKGLGIVVVGDYGDKDVSIYFADDASEIVMWNEEEWESEPSLLAKIAEALCCGCIHGPESLRDQFRRPKPKFGDDDYDPWGGWGALVALHDSSRAVPVKPPNDGTFFDREGQG